MQFWPRLNLRSVRASAFSTEQPRWHYLYYVLALFDICAVLVSLFVNHRIMQIYTESVATNQMWVGIWHDASELGELAAAIDAPGNDVFQSRDVERESGKLAHAIREFQHRMASLVNGLDALGDNDRIRAMREDLRAVRTTTSQMVRDAKLTFTYFSAGRGDKATVYMASMDRRFSTVNSTLIRLRSRIGALQNDSFERQTSAAAMLQKSEYLIAGMITLMILGATVYGRMIASQVFQVTALKETYRDELEQKVSERTAALKAANDARAELLKLLISAQEDERRRIARDLHDGVGQALTYLTVNLRRLESATDDAASTTQIAKLREVTSETLEDVRRLARGLRPSVLDDLGLRPALERLTHEFATAHKIRVELKNETCLEERLPETIETALFRIVQEALTNIGKHAGATEAAVLIQRDDQAVSATVSDNGVGFETQKSGKATQTTSSVGLASISERAAILGGTALIESWPGSGTSVQIRLPIPRVE